MTSHSSRSSQGRAILVVCLAGIMWALPSALRIALGAIPLLILLNLIEHPTLALANGVHLSPGFVQQHVLVILRFPPQPATNALSANDESYINSQLSAVSNFLWTNSNQSLLVTFETIKFEQSLVASEYECFNSPNCTAFYDNTLDQYLRSRLVSPAQYAGVVMIYQPTNVPPRPGCTSPPCLFYNTQIWFNSELDIPVSSRHSPGFSAIFYSGNNPNQTPPLSQFIEHEYLHQLHHRFAYEIQDSAPPVVDQTPPHPALAPDGFIDSDWMTTPGAQNPCQLSTIAQDLEQLIGTTFTPCDDGDPTWLAATLKYWVRPGDNQNPNPTLHLVNYRWLEGRYPDNVVLGAFDGGKLKEKYDFAQSDDALVYVSGNNITTVMALPNTIPSFWFRALPGQTAAFGTQTGFGIYLLSQVAFNYEIAPGDFTFQVYLVYYNVNNVNNELVNVRIDDGIFNLGRQEFAHNRKVITLPLPQEVEDFQIVFQKGNQLSGAAANDDWVLLGNISLNTSLAP